MRPVEKLLVSSAASTKAGVKECDPVVDVMGKPVVVQVYPKRANLRAVVAAVYDDAPLQKEKIEAVSYQAVGCAGELY